MKQVSLRRWLAGKVIREHGRVSPQDILDPVVGVEGCELIL